LDLKKVSYIGTTTLNQILNQGFKCSESACSILIFFF
jgi:hypothetical protein